ncbi:F-box/LRR-repeat protein At5g02910-like [Zingiber officinale]|uniref:F-box domain-containing protein n=1 Tax=Zingiber officinale TaxID=94328 RepID=A0A8J5H5W5_ZINOF|nr:F-box/LRR-repeat protein At5g02910-like [Zingiber officinale]KAG6516749.1 hypothetical protein ZIOFF_027223 [Zingiber officinale]
MDDSGRRLPARRRRLAQQSEGEDYLSGLPDSLLHHILSFLPTRDSVRSSLLARRWRRLWESVPAIVFSSVDKSSANSVDRFLASRSCSCSISHLRLFKIKLEDGGALVRDLLIYAKSHGAQDVTLRQFFFPSDHLPLFDILFDWPSLVALNLQLIYTDIWEFTLPNRIIFSNLKTLSLMLGIAEISATSLARLLSCCPVLEELTLKSFYPWNCSIEIAAPNLRRLTLHRGTDLRIICPKLGFLAITTRNRLKRLHLEAPSLTSIQMHCFFGWIKLSRRFCDVNEEAAASVGDIHLEEFPLAHLVCYELFLV